jgi:benzylsuccinate CoA-transferase BbsF subunit
MIMVSSCLWGQTGPERAYPGFGGQGSALAGFNYLTGWPNREPLGPFGTITDSLSPRYTAVAICAALLRRERTGRGTFIDVSQVETAVYSLTEWLLAYSATGRSFGRIGNRSLHAVPHGVFAAAGEERWIALAVHSDDDWKRLRAALADPVWARSPELDRLDGRLAGIDAIEAGIAAWARERNAEEAVAQLRSAGLDAALVEDMQDLLADDQLAHRGHFNELAHPVLGRHVVEANGMRFSDSPMRFERPAPCLAADSEHVYREILGLADAELAELKNAGVLS